MLIAKPEAYGIGNNALGYIYNYLKQRKQRTKVGNSYSSWKELIYGLPQGSILGPILFNIFINDIFLFIDETKIAKYADGTTTYAIEDNVPKLLESETTIILNWFHANEMKSNDQKYNLFVANKENVSLGLGNDSIDSSETVKLLGGLIDKQLNLFLSFVKKETRNCIQDA